MRNTLRTLGLLLLAVCISGYTYYDSDDRVVFRGGLRVGDVTGPQCLEVDAQGVIQGSGVTCGGTGSGAVIAVESRDSQVGDADIERLDFGPAFYIYESPDQEINIEGQLHDARTYDASCNGVADDTTEIQAAIDAACAAGGGRVFIPAGTCLLSDSLDIFTAACDGVMIVGAGRDVTTLQMTATWDSSGSVPAIEIRDADGVQVRDLTIIHAETAVDITTGTAIDGEPRRDYTSAIYVAGTAAMRGPRLQSLWLENWVNGIRLRGDTNYTAATVDTVIRDVIVRGCNHGILGQVQERLTIENLDAELIEHQSANPGHPIYLNRGNGSYTQRHIHIRGIRCRPGADNVDCNTTLRDVNTADVSHLYTYSPSSGYTAQAVFHANGLQNALVTNVLAEGLDPGAGGSAFAILCGSSGYPACTDNVFSDVTIELEQNADRVIVQLEDNGTTTNIARNVFTDFSLRNDKATTTQPSIVVEGEDNTFSTFVLEQVNAAAPGFYIGGGTGNRFLEFDCHNCTTTGSLYRAGTAQTGLFIRYVDDSGVGQARLLGTGSGNFGDSGTVADGSQVYCPDCLVATTCSGGGTGAIATRLNDTWMCGTGPAGSDTHVQWNNGGSFGGEDTFTYDDANNRARLRRGDADTWTLALGWDENIPDTLPALGKTALMYLIGDDDADNPAVGVINRGPTIGLLKPDIDATDANQSTAELYLGATRSVIADFGSALDPVGDGDVLGRIGFFGSDGSTSMNDYSAAITAVVDETNESVATARVPAQLRIQTQDDTPIIFGTNVTSSLCCGGSIATGTRMSLDSDSADLTVDIVTTGTITSGDQTSAPGNRITLYDNDTDLTPDPTCANSGVADRLTIIDTDETSADNWTFCNGTSLANEEYRTECDRIVSPAGTENYLWFRAETDITVTGIDCLVNAATSVVVTIQECNGDGGSCAATEAAITCGTTNTTEASGIDDADIDAGDWIRVVLGTVSGTPGHVAYCLTYTVD